MIPSKTLWTAAAIAMALELMVTFGIPAAIPGHLLMHDYISTAGATDSPAPGAFATLGIMAALIHLIFVIGIGLRGSGRLHRWSTGLFAGFFVFLAIGLMFQCDPGCALETTEAWMHFWFGLAAFLSLGVAALLTMASAWRGNDWALFGAGAALATFDILLLLSDQTRILQGLTERATIVAMMVWSVVWMVRLDYLDFAAASKEAEVQ